MHSYQKLSILREYLSDQTILDEITAILSEDQLQELFNDVAEHFDIDYEDFT